MDRRFLTVLGVSLVFALVVSSVFYQMTARSGGSRRTDVSDQKDIVVATRPLSTGVMIKPADVKVIRVGADAFPKGAFGKVEEVLDRPVVSSILLDEPVLEGRLASKGSGLGLAPTIPVGMRALAVRVNDVAGVAGFVLPGMRVDVLVTGRPPNAEGTITNTVLQNILVLSAGQIMQADARGQAIQAPTVTLLVTPEQAETLTLSNNEGHIQLVLRNSSDETIERTTGKNISELYGSAIRATPTHPKPADASDFPPPPRPRPRPVAVVAAAPPPPPAAAPVAPLPPPPDQVVVIRGTVKTIETLPAATRTAND
jgi:pilus assembly protein CpaB